MSEFTGLPSDPKSPPCRDLVAQSDRMRFEHERFHAELYRQLRFTAADSERTRDGLDVRTLELPPGAVHVLHFLRKWPRIRFLNHFGLSRMMSMPSRWSVCRSGAVGILTVGEPAVSKYLAGGRALERIWLACHGEGPVAASARQPADIYRPRTPVERLRAAAPPPRHRGAIGLSE